MIRASCKEFRSGESLKTERYDGKHDPLESSWGPFQLNRRRGLGVQFEKETGLDVRDPNTIAAQARWGCSVHRQNRAPRSSLLDGISRSARCGSAMGNSGYAPSAPSGMSRLSDADLPAARRRFGDDFMQRAREAGMVGSGEMKGSATIDLNINGLPSRPAGARV